jgi:hypothetical protein
MQRAITYRATTYGRNARGHLGIALLLLSMGGYSVSAHAVLTWGSLGTPQSISLQIGSTSTGNVNSVNFDVSNALLAPNNASVQGTPSSDTPSTSPTGGVPIIFSATFTSRAATNYVNVKVTATTPVGLTCVAGSGCGSTVVPFNTISWVAYGNGTDSNSQVADVKSGTFVNNGTQNLSYAGYKGSSPTVSNNLIFNYNASTIYPAGRYTGRVTYTATIL